MRAQTRFLPIGSALTAPASLLLPTYAATLFWSAGLLFLVQPMVAKMVLPRLGGSPSVWNTAMCFFQATLLLGYLYAHVLATRFSRVAQAAVHAAVLSAAAAFLPFDLTQAVPPADGVPVLWLIGELAVTIGPPFFALSATAPLLQRWFSRTDHPSAGYPYFLYAASNGGSLLALLAYPLVVEPNLTLVAQSRGWTLGAGLAAVGVGLCWLGRRGESPEERAVVQEAAHPTMGERVRWVAYAFVPSALLLAVTAHITTDLAAAPLFWVIPLALYLLTFILAFASKPPLPQWLMLRLQPFLVIPLVVMSVAIHDVVLLVLHLALFFVTAMICHGELARCRPPAQHLTGFYLCVSLGGVLGGIFTALIAPAVFPDIWEYPLLLAASCLVRPRPTRRTVLVRCGDWVLPMLLLDVLYAATRAPPWVLFAALATTAVVLMKFSERRVRFALGVTASLLVAHIVGATDTEATSRSFFGVYHVRVADLGLIRILQHGTTVHGAESTLPREETVPLGYYNRAGPFGRFFAAMEARGLKTVGIVGLGAGDLACYAKPEQNWTFHEIDPEVERLARDRRYFHFLERCGNEPAVMLGDARLTLRDVPDRHYDALVIDAFSSDSIPLHLLTREALALYQRKLAENGVILFHISNRFLDLAPVLAALAADSDSPVRDLRDLPPSPSVAHLAAEVVAIGQPGRSLDDLTAAEGWRRLPVPPASALWTDARSDIIGRIRWRAPPSAP